MRNLIKICTKCHSKRSHVVAKSKNLLSSWCSKAAIGAFVFGALLVACGDDNSGKNAGGTEEDSGIVAIADKTVSGVSQKGPFVNGSSVTVQELDGESLAQTGGSFEGKIKNDMGEFSVKVKNLESQYALLKANGFYRNEVTGEKSKSQVTLYALTDLSDRDEVNVNLLTHMEYERSLYLAAEGLSVGKAKKQAESEVLASFGIEGDFASAEDLSIFGTDDGAAALLAVSVLMQGDLSEADFSERLANYAADIEQDGKWDDFITATVIADWASNRSLTGILAAIRNNIAGWGLAADVPAFEKYVDRYWWQVYSLGFCDKDREGEVKAAENALSGNNGVHFICGDGAWRKATDIEKDTYKWESGKDGDVKNGDVVETNCYVFEDSVWRSGNEKDCSLKLRGCTVLRQDTVGKGSDEVWYICGAKNWRRAIDIEKDTATWGAGEFDGEVRAGQVNSAIHYIYEKQNMLWRVASVLEADTYGEICSEFGKVIYGKVDKNNKYFCNSIEWRYFFGSDSVVYEKLIDERDGQIYRAVDIGNQTWMAENLNYADSIAYPSMQKRNMCSSQENCKKLGRFYTWAAAIDSVNWFSQGVKCGWGIKKCNLPEKVQGVCPDGWHVPNEAEWEELFSFMGKKINAMQAKGFGEWNNAADIYGFSALPAGYFENNHIVSLYREAAYWTSDLAFDEQGNGAFFWHIAYDKGFFNRGSYHDDDNKSKGLSIRCVKGKGSTIPPVAEALGLCTEHIADSVGLFEDDYYICNSGKWVRATVLQYDTYRYDCIEDGQTINGKVNKDIEYICEDKKWRRSCGKDSVFCREGLIDNRDLHIYKTVTIGNQIWMAENLNFDTTGAKCFENDSAYCKVYGKLYPANIAQTVCPAGWHLPNETEFRQLVDFAENSFEKIKSTEWDGLDTYGFAALPAGKYDAISGGSFTTEQYSTGWWLSSSETYGLCPLYGVSGTSLYSTGDDCVNGFSVRCVKDEE